jgi:hypothetical protein
VTEAKVKYVVKDTDRHGNVRWYFRRNAWKARLECGPKDDRFLEFYLKAAADYMAAQKVFPKPRDEIRKRSGFVYFIRSGEFVKIGYSKNPIKRLDILNTGMGTRARFVLSVPGTMKDEKQLHGRFARNRANGEWFRMGPSIEQFLHDLVAGNGEQTGDDSVSLAVRSA